MTKYEITEKRTIESQQLEEKRHNEDIMGLERSIQQLQVPPLYGNEVAVNVISLITGLLISQLSSHLGPNDRNHDTEGVNSSSKKDTN